MPIGNLRQILSFVLNRSPDYLSRDKNSRSLFPSFLLCLYRRESSNGAEVGGCRALLPDRAAAGAGERQRLLQPGQRPPQQGAPRTGHHRFFTRHRPCTHGICSQCLDSSSIECAPPKPVSQAHPTVHDMNSFMHDC